MAEQPPGAVVAGGVCRQPRRAGARSAIPPGAYGGRLAASGLSDSRQSCHAGGMGAVANLHAVWACRCRQARRVRVGGPPNGRRTAGTPHSDGLAALRRGIVGGGLHPEFLALATGERFGAAAVRPLLAAAFSLPP